MTQQDTTPIKDILDSYADSATAWAEGWLPDREYKERRAEAEQALNDYIDNKIVSELELAYRAYGDDLSRLPLPDIDTQIEEILDVLIMGYCPELIGDINKSFQYYTKAHKAIKTLLIQSKIDELERLKSAHNINIFDEYTDKCIKELKKELG